MSESLKLGHNLDFSSCNIMVGFHKSSHIYILVLMQLEFLSNRVSSNIIIKSNSDQYILV